MHVQKCSRCLKVVGTLWEQWQPTLNKDVLIHRGQLFNALKLTLNIQNTNLAPKLKIGMSGQFEVGCHSGGRHAMTLVNRYFHHSSPFSITSFLIERLIRSKTFLVKVDGSTQEPGVRPLSKTHQSFWGPLMVILDFAGGERVPPLLQGWYHILFFGSGGGLSTFEWTVWPLKYRVPLSGTHKNFCTILWS